MKLSTTTPTTWLPQGSCCKPEYGQFNTTQWSMTIDLSGVTIFPTSIGFFTDATAHRRNSINFEGLAFSVIIECDTDGDGIADVNDLDSDGDSISDLIESGVNASLVDPDDDGMYDVGAVDNDGVPTAASGGVTPVDTDGDGIPDTQDSDSDDDGATDADEGASDSDNDGLPDYQDNNGGLDPVVSNNPTPTLSGKTFVAPGETLSITINGVTYIAGDGNLVANTDSTWALSIPSNDALPEGTYDVATTVTDADGNAITDIAVGSLSVDITDPATPSSNIQITNNTTPTITGTATVVAGESLTVTVGDNIYTSGDGNLALNGNNWALIIPAEDALDDGNYEVIAIVTDQAGNFATGTSTLSVDTVLPITPVITTRYSAVNTPIISINATVGTGETFTVTVNNTIYSSDDDNLALNSEGIWELTVPDDNELQDGDYEVVATVTDEAGNVANNTSTLTVDTVDPATPSTTTRYGTTDTPTISFDATVATGETFTVTVNNTIYSSDDDNLAQNSEGIWELTIPEGSGLPDGDYEVIAAVTDEAGNVSTSTSTLTVDTVLPATPVITTRYSTTSTPVISGNATVITGETLTVTFNEVTYIQGDGNLVLNENGSWALTVPNTNDGDYEVVATVTDEAGNVATSTSTLTVDTVDPVTPSTTTRYGTTDTPTISVDATVAIGETFTVTVNDITYSPDDDNLVLNSEGIWELTIPEGSELPDGDYDVIATVTDEAGNVSTSTNTLTVDTVIPTTPLITTRYSATEILNIFGNAAVLTGETLTVTFNEVTYTQGDGNLVLNGNGSWALTVPNTNDGDYEVVATVTDEAGNVATSASTLTVDTVDPVAPSITTRYGTTNTPTISIDATVATGETFTVTVNNFTYSPDDDDLAQNSEGIWELSIPEGSELLDDDYEVIATVTDEAGNVAFSASTLTVDTVLPATPLITTRYSNTEILNIFGNAAVLTGETLTVTFNEVTYTQGDDNLVLNENGSWALTVSNTDDVDDGDYEVVATVTDEAGNVATSMSTLTVDTVDPVTPSITTRYGTTDTPTISIDAVVITGETFTVTVNDSTYSQDDDDLALNSEGIWELTIPQGNELLDGDYQVTATVTDEAGNVSTSTTTLTVDTVPPATPSVTTRYSTTNTPIISIDATVATGEIFTVTVNDITYSQDDDNLELNSEGIWELTISEGSELSDRDYQITSTVTDEAGNVATSTSTLTVDTVNPATPSITTRYSPTNTPIISIDATVATGETLNVFVNDTTYSQDDDNLSLNSEGIWQLTVPEGSELPDGDYEVIATVTDEAGNVEHQYRHTDCGHRTTSNTINHYTIQ